MLHFCIIGGRFYAFLVRSKSNAFNIGFRYWFDTVWRILYSRRLTFSS